MDARQDSDPPLSAPLSWMPAQNDSPHRCTSSRAVIHAIHTTTKQMKFAPILISQNQQVLPMSSTNRGAERQPDDFYETPAWCTHAILPHLNIKPAGTILDPFAGAGAILKASSELKNYITLTGIEKDPDRAARCREIAWVVRCGDAFEHEWYRADVILTNPPYSLALQSVQRSCDYLAEWGTGKAAFLLRLAFLETKERNQFLRNRMPDNIYVLPRRPAFIKGKTDSCAYAWFVWGPERRNESKLSVLEVTK